MSNKPFSIIFYGILMILIQVVFVNNINIIGQINPKIAPIFLLFLPRSIAKINLMLIGLLFGFLIDYFSISLGIHMAASVFICFLKPYIFQLMYNKSEDEEPLISASLQGQNFIFRYLTISLLIYHLTYFFIEIGQFYNIFYVLLKSILSTVLAIILYAVFTMMFHLRVSQK